MKKNIWVKLLCICLCICMCTGILAACGGQSDTNEAGNNAVSSTTPAEKVEKPSKPVELRLAMFGDAGARNMEFWENEFNAKIKEELNITIEVDYFPWGDGYNTVQTMAASGEAFGFMWHPKQMANSIQRGYLAELDMQKINELMPDLLNARQGLDFASCSYQGKVYAIPTGAQPWSAPLDNFWIRNDILNQVGWDYTQIETLEDLEEALAAVHEKFPDMVIGNSGFRAYTSTYCTDGSIIKNDMGNFWTVDESDPDSDEVISFLETELFAEVCRQAERWQELGFYNENYLDASYSTTQWNAGNCVLRNGAASRLIDHELAGVEGADVRQLVLNNNPKIMYQNFDWAWAVSSAAQDQAEDYMRLFNWIYSSHDNFMFCMYGVEGVDWEYAEDGKTVNLLTSDTFFYDWMHNTTAYMDTTAYDPADLEEYLHWDDDAITSKTVGFVFDNSNVKAEEAALNAIYTEFIPRYQWGFESYDESFAEVLEMLKDAGLDTYLAEVQRQFSEFMANK